MTRQLGGCLKALLTTVALERLLPQVDPLVKVQLTLVLEAALAVATDEGLALLVDQLVEAQRVRVLNVAAHSSHLCGQAALCVRSSWANRSNLLENLAAHMSHWWGLPPKWTFLCTFMLARWEKRL